MKHGEQGVNNGKKPPAGPEQKRRGNAGTVSCGNGLSGPGGVGEGGAPDTAMQVLSDWNGPKLLQKIVGEPGDEGGGESMRKWKDLISECMESYQAKEAAENPVKQEKKARLPNLQMVMAYDHTLQVSLQLSLKHFIPCESDRLRPLVSTEERYYVTKESLPPELCDRRQQQRSCIKTADGTSRLELPQARSHTPRCTRR